MNDPYEAENRKFLHDFATPLAILRLITKRLLKLKPDVATTDLLQKAVQAIETMENVHAEFRSRISERQKSDGAA